jgi:protocatechuate 3,4-dioxygenase beta subunit
MKDPGTDLLVPDLMLELPATIEGRVLDGQGSPAPGIRVLLRDWDFATNDQRSGGAVEVITDRQGRYRFMGAPPGGAWLQLAVTDQHPRGRVVAPFEVEAGKSYTFELQQPKAQ